MSGFLLGFLVFFPFLGGLLVALAGRKDSRTRDYLADAVVILEFIVMLILFLTLAKTAGAAAQDGSFWNRAAAGFSIEGLVGMGLHFEADGFRLLYGLITALMWMMTTILSREYCAHHHNTNRFYLFMMLTLGATMGVFLSADLMTTFIFFEIMSFTSYVWVAQEENAPSLRAAETYLAVAVFGGLVMLMGLFLLYHEVGTLTIDELYQAVQTTGDPKVLYAAGACMLVGFGAKAGAFPLHIWLPKAHPVAPAPASALLSGVLTKTGIYGILILSTNLFLHDAQWGSLILWLGVITMFGGALLAVFSIDLKRTLACSSMSQIGFIMVGIGMQGLLGEENALAVHGTLLHMMNHSMIKLVLFMAAGVIFMNTHSLDLNKIRGYGRKKTLLKVIFAIGALAIAGVPMFSGYISKTLLHESIVEYGGDWTMKAVEWIFLISGGMTAAYMTKLFGAIFVEKNANAELQRSYDNQKNYMNRESTFALAGSALILLIWGLFPNQIMDRAAELGQSFMGLTEFGHRVHYFSWECLKGGLISLCIGAVIYVCFIRTVLMRETGTVSAKESGNAAASKSAKKKNGKKSAKAGRAYVNLWPKWLDLENLIYRPLITLLSLVCGLFCRLLDTLVDLIVVVLRKTIYKDSPLPHELPEGSEFTVIVGRIANFLNRLLNHTVRRKAPVIKDYEHILAVKMEELHESNNVITRSLSFALMLLCIGFALTLFYIIRF